jgi:hypothetical protein
LGLAVFDSTWLLVLCAGLLSAANVTNSVATVALLNTLHEDEDSFNSLMATVNFLWGAGTMAAPFLLSVSLTATGGVLYAVLLFLSGFVLACLLAALHQPEEQATQKGREEGEAAAGENSTGLLIGLGVVSFCTVGVEI